MIALIGIIVLIGGVVSVLFAVLFVFFLDIYLSGFKKDATATTHQPALHDPEIFNLKETSFYIN